MAVWTDFPGGRMPLADPEAEAARTALYWAWLEQHQSDRRHAGRTVHEFADGGHVALLSEAQEADHEAARMRHSIGHSWTKYSAMGAIYGLRSASGESQATLLVIPPRPGLDPEGSRGTVVHAREHRNARLSPANQMRLEDFAAVMRFEIRPDRLPFEVLGEPDAPNTRLEYLFREASGEKRFGLAVFAGRLDEGQIEDLASGLHETRFFDPAAVGLPCLREGEPDRPGMDHEILSVRGVFDSPDRDMGARAFHEAWEQMASAGWQQGLLAPRPR